MEQLLMLAYSAWALYSGYNAVSGRSEWLDRKEPLSIVVKAVASYVAGIFIGAYQLMILLLKFLSIIMGM